MNSLLIGGSGLVGSWVIQLYPTYFPMGQLVVFIRKSASSSFNSQNFQSQNIQFVEVDFDDESTWDRKYLSNTETLICTLGTTIKKAGSKQAFRKVDYDYPLAFAKWSLKHSFKRMSIVTAMGSNSKSGIFYSQVKGELEEELAKLEIQNLSIFQPSLILGDRKERRIGEEIGKIAAGIIPFSLFGLDKIKPIQAEVISRAILANLQTSIISNIPNIQIFESDAIQKFAKPET
ncbi:hypothetical protein [Leptospira sp. GIMC2001]|uniref:hypothetical protein n=1 Tax=Leptospira sp. GIMC2001 TaxID=1513297 RepID=UPI0023498D7B|nr:hypothetical protein [Leptospira sp. GIMC2001]WCL48557.1 hypothetical protein O4O04_14780 [Leptospira sp. GIMC2001]